MSRVRYPLFFILAVVLLTVATLSAYGRIGAAASSRAKASRTTWPGDTAAVQAPAFAIPTRADYERYAEADKAWRQQNAREFTLAELRARGDGRRSEREALDDRVYALTKRGSPQRAISELERWVARHPRDKSALLSLARLLRENGRADAAVARYRQLLALENQGRR
jgi:tetratricopeptide (TPR) repeat protein